MVSDIVGVKQKTNQANHLEWERTSEKDAKQLIKLIGGCGASHTREAACYRKPQLLK